jgi:nucleotide-binding universal stress UspA family protein
MKRTNIRNILVPVDFSEISEPAIETAEQLAKRFGAAVHLVHVHEYYYPIGFIAPGAPVPMSMMAFREDTTEQIADRFKALAGKHGIPTTHCHVRNEIPVFNGVCKVARQINANLIVTPTHGYTGVTNFLEGGHAERLVQHSPCPVWVARNREKKSRRVATNGKASGRIDRILIPVDFSQSSFQALEYAIEFAERVAAKLIVFHAVNLGYAFTADGYGMCDLSNLVEAARQGVEHQMQEFLKLAKFRGVKFEVGVKVGSPVSEICAFAEQRDVDLIITATHGRTGLKHLLMGSVAEHVVRHADRPVLVVPSHPEVRAARLTRGIRRDRQSTGHRAKSQASVTSTERLAKRNRKLAAHPSPERRQTNKFRESHSL